MYCRAHKTATLTPIQHTVGGTESLFSLVFLNLALWNLLNLFYFHRVRVFAPFTPFLTEHMYQNLKHLVDWSKKEEETNKRSVHAFTEQFYRSDLLVLFTVIVFYQSNLLVLLWLKIVSVPFMSKNFIYS